MAQQSIPRFRRLQWKLTTYYTFFTSLLGLLTLIAFLVLGWLLLTSPVANSVFASIISAPLVDDIAPLLNSAETQPQLNRLLEEIVEGSPIPVEEINEIEDIKFSTIFSGIQSTLISDRNGIIVAAQPATGIGEPLRDTLSSGERNTLDSVYEIPFIVLNRANRQNGVDTIFVPIREQGEIQGLLVFRYASPQSGPFAFAALASVVVVPLMLPVLCLSGIVGTVFGLVVARGLSIRLKNLANSADSWAAGDFTVSVNDPRSDEIGHLGRQLNGMATQLDTLMHSRSQLAMIEERNRIARDLHDSAKQQIFATTMQISTAKALLEMNPEQAKQHLSEAEQLAKSVQKELSGLIEELRPAQLEGQGLFAAVRDSAETFARQNSIPVDVRIQGERELPVQIEQPLFRIMQESLNNIAKHSGATQVTINLTATNAALTLRIHDNGSGFTKAQAKGSGIGLRSMQERIGIINGKLQIKSGSEKGTTVSAEVPLLQARIGEVAS